MPLVYVDGFEDASGLILRGGAPAIVAGRNGNGIRYTDLSSSYGYRLRANADTFTLGVALRIVNPNSTGSNPYIEIFDEGNGGQQCSVLVTTAGALQFNRASVVLGTSANGMVPSGTWVYLEVQGYIHDTLGTLVGRINGTTVLTVTNVDTKQSIGTTFSLVGFAAGTNASAVNTVQFDDFYLCTKNGGSPDAFLGDCRVETLYPNGDGASNTWVGSDGDSVNNWQLVDEVPPDPADYVSSATAGQQDLYTLTDLSSTSQPVLAVCPTAYAGKTDGTTRSVKTLTRRTATNASAALALDTTYTVYQAVLTTDPETSAAWTPANVNALQAGVEAA